MQEKLPVLKIVSIGNDVDPSSAEVLHRLSHRDEVDHIHKLLQHGADVDARSESGWTSLQVAAAHNSLGAVEALLEARADIESRNANGSTSLHLSSGNGNLEIVKTLLNHGADVSAKNTQTSLTALHLAAMGGWLAILEVLIDKGAEVHVGDGRGHVPLHQAAQNGHLNCVVRLISAGSDVNARAFALETPLHAAVVKNHKSIVQVLIQNGANVDAAAKHGVTATMLAALDGNVEMLEALISAGANLDLTSQGGETATMIAAYSGHTETLGALISAGANLDLVCHRGHTALCIAITHGKVKAALLLLKNRPNVDMSYTGHQDRALHLAVRQRQPKIIQAVLDQGIDIEACDSDGDTALHWAAEIGDIESAEVLLRGGAQINKRNKRTGFSVLHWACIGGHVAMVRCLLAYGGDATSVDTAILQMKEGTNLEDFELCKALIETAPHTPDMQQPWGEPISRVTSSSSEEIQETRHAPSEFSKVVEETTDDASSPIRNPVLEMKDHVAAKMIITKFQHQIEHKGVRCDGPLCENASAFIYGIRYKCVCCEDKDFCSTCISSVTNEHDTSHQMIQCLLPVRSQITDDLNRLTRRVLIETGFGVSNDVQSIRHILFVRLDGDYLQLIPKNLSCSRDIDWHALETLVQDSGPHLFTVVNTSRGVMVQRRDAREIDRTKSDLLFTYEADVSEMIRLKYHPLTDSNTRCQMAQRATEGVHHSDADQIVKDVGGKLTLYNYQQDDTFHKWAMSGILATRVIELMPGTFEDEIFVRIRTVDLKEYDDYEALSYTWKETAYNTMDVWDYSREIVEPSHISVEQQDAICCLHPNGNQEYLMISSGLSNALRRLRDPTNTKRYWIDQLSINQQDYHERAFQVARMVYCYDRSQRVLVWTGDENETTERIFDLLRDVARLSRESCDLATLNQQGLTPFSDPIWCALAEFSTRPVFTRCWVVQEIVVGKRVVVRCGRYEIDWSEFSDAFQMIGESTWLRTIFRHGYRRQGGTIDESTTTQRRKLIKPFTNIVMINGLRGDFQHLRNASLEFLLYSTGFFEATEPRDRIYSLVGLQSAEIRPGSQEELLPHYDHSIAQVFTNATKYCINQTSSFGICGLIGDLSNNKTKDLPSWVPDFTSDTSHNIFAFSREDRGSHYNASIDWPIIAAWPYVTREDMLVISSCNVETIAAVSGRAMSDRGIDPTLVTEWTEVIASVYSHEPNHMYSTGESLAEAFLRSCIANRTQLPGTPTVELLAAVVRIVIHQYLVAAGCNDSWTLEQRDQCIRDATNPVIASIACGIPRVDSTMREEASKADDNRNDPTRGPEISNRLSVVKNAIANAGANRKFFVTQRGIFGLGPSEMRIDDEVHILAGARVPFILRRANESQDPEATEIARADGLDLYYMVGEAYVHAYMEGEVAKREDVSWDGICLI